MRELTHHYATPHHTTKVTLFHTTKVTLFHTALTHLSRHVTRSHFFLTPRRFLTLHETTPHFLTCISNLTVLLSGEYETAGVQAREPPH